MDGVVVPASLLTDLVTGPIERLSQSKSLSEYSHSRSKQCSIQTAVSVLNLDETGGFIQAQIKRFS